MLNSLGRLFNPARLQRQRVATDAPSNVPSNEPIRRQASGLAAEYRDNFDYRDEMESLKLQHPGQVQIAELGKSVQGRTLSAMTVGTGPVGLVITGLIHGCEWTGGEAALGVGEYLLKNRPDLLEKASVIILPCSNPDGNEVSRGVARSYRSNVNGVDLARNMPVNWGTNEFTPHQHCHDIGGTGSSPISEPESQALDRLVQSDGLAGWLDLHSYGEMILHPKSDRPEEYLGLIADMQRAVPHYEPVKLEDYGDATGTLADYCESKQILHVVAELGTGHQPQGEKTDQVIGEGVALGVAFVEHMVDKG